MAEYKGPKLGQLSPVRRARRIAVLAANPETRAAIPDAYLPSKFRTGRKVARAGAQQVAPGLTRGQLNTQVNAAATQQFGPQESQLAGEAGRIPQWYTDYVNQIGAAAQRQQQVSQQAVQGVQGLQSGLDQAAMQQWAGQQAAMAADAANRGATVSPQSADVAHNASNVRNALTGTFGAQLLAQGVGEQNFLANRGLVAGQQGVEALGRNAAAQQQLAAQKGAFKVTEGAGLIKSANDAFNARQQAELAAATKQLALKQAGIRIKQTQQTQQFDRHKWNQQTNPTYGMSNGAVVQLRKTPEGQARLAAAQAAQNKLLHPPRKSSAAGNGKDQYGNTSLQRTSRTSQLRNIIDDAKGQIAFNRKHGQATDWASVRAALAGDYPNVNADILIGAVQMAALGRVGPKTAKALRQLGVDPSYFSAGGKTVRKVQGGTGLPPAASGGRRT